jgi:hypothetical protein
MDSFEHGDADQAHNNHMHQQFLMEGGWRATMPAGSLHGVFEITVKRLDSDRRLLPLRASIDSDLNSLVQQIQPFLLIIANIGS